MAHEGRALRAGILGTGGVARLHAEALEAIDGAKLVAVADTSSDRAEEFALAWGVRAVDDLAGLLDAGVDVVHLCTPPAGHAEQAERALAAGAHVVVEKPPALSLRDVDRMRHTAASAHRMLAVVFQQRTGTAVAHVKRLLDAGAFGRPLVALCQTFWRRGADYYAVPWRGTWAGEGGGPTFGLGIHQIDLLAYLLGEWREADGRFWRLDHDIEQEDLGAGTIVFESGAVASVVTTTLAARETSVVRIDAEHATIELEHLYGHAHAHWRITPAPGVPETDAASWALPAGEVPSGHDALLVDVYDAIRAGAPVPPVGAEPARALEIITAMHRAAGMGRPVSRAELADPALRGPLRAPVETP